MDKSKQFKQLANAWYEYQLRLVIREAEKKGQLDEKLQRIKDALDHQSEQKELAS